MAGGSWAVAWVALVLLLAGGASAAVGLVARQRLNPSAIEVAGETFRIERTRKAGVDAETVNLLSAQGELAGSFSGSLDFCATPDVLALDVDRDGASDAYYSTCADHGYFRLEQGALKKISLGQHDRRDAPGLDTFWAHEVEAGGSRLLLAGFCMAGAGLMFLAGMLGNRALSALGARRRRAA
jgi:hypothetical protein